MMQRFCDRCSKPIKTGHFWKIELEKYASSACMVGGTYDTYDLCEDCLKAVRDFIEGNNKA